MSETKSNPISNPATRACLDPIIRSVVPGSPVAALLVGLQAADAARRADVRRGLLGELAAHALPGQPAGEQPA